MDPCGRDGPDDGLAPLSARVARALRKPAGGTTRGLPLGGLVSRRAVDVLQCRGRRSLASLAPTFPRRNSPADDVRTQRGGGPCDLTRGALLNHLGGRASEHD